MIKTVRTERRARRWGRRIVTGVGSLLVIVPALHVIGAFLPRVDYLYGSLVMSLWPAWLIVLPLIGALLVRNSGRGAVRTVVPVIAVVTALGATLAVVRLVSVAHENGVRVSAANAFGFSGSLALVAPDEIVTYAHEGGEALTLRLFRPKGRAPAGGWPVYMHIHGGGWTGGSNEEQSADMRWFADRGWYVISVGYSLSSASRHMWDRVSGQIGCAMAWTDANIRRRGGNPGRLALRGGSAGGNLALNAAYMANADRLPSSCGGRVPHVRSVTPIYPGVDLVVLYDTVPGPTGLDVRPSVVNYLGGTPKEVPQRYRAANSATHISAAAPPTLMFLSANDHVVPPESMRAFADKAAQAGVAIQVITVPFGEHGFDLTGIGNELVKQASLRFIDAHDDKSVAVAVRPAPAKLSRD